MQTEQPGFSLLLKKKKKTLTNMKEHRDLRRAVTSH